MSAQSHLTNTFYQPTEENMASLQAWFDNYDMQTANKNADALVKEAHLPITVITDDSNGECITQQWEEDAFRASLQGADGAEIKNDRQYFFLSDNLAVVITEAEVTAADGVQYMRYADILVKKEGEWKFKCMIQAGWGDMLKEYFGA